MLSCPVTVPLTQIENEIGKGKSVAFRRLDDTRPLDNSLPIEQVLIKVF
jgi:hypothetical protein